MADKIKLNYPQMEEVAQHMKTVEQRLLQTVAMAHSVAQQMQGGALVGDAGDAFASALNGSFTKSVTKLSQKFGEVANDIKKAISDMKSADQAAGSKF